MPQWQPVRVVRLGAEMSRLLDTRAIAARIRALIAAEAHSGLDDVARRLGIPEPSLRISVDEVLPHPTLDVLAAIVREYAVDPGWLVHGEYDGATHRAALDEDNVTPATVLRLATSARHLTPADVQVVESELSGPAT